MLITFIDVIKRVLQYWYQWVLEKIGSSKQCGRQNRIHKAKGEAITISQRVTVYLCCSSCSVLQRREYIICLGTEEEVIKTHTSNYT